MSEIKVEMFKPNRKRYRHGVFLDDRMISESALLEDADLIARALTAMPLAERMAAELLEDEWANYDDQRAEFYCRICNRVASDGHSDGCERGILLREWAAMNEQEGGES